MKTTKFTKLLGMGAILAGLLISPMAPAAFADTTGGGDGGGNGSSTSGTRQWAAVAYNAQGKAYDNFLNRSGYSKATTESLIRAKGVNLQVCKNSNAIWWLQNTSTNGWSHEWSGATNGSGWRGNGTIKNPAKTYGDRAPSKFEYDTFISWDKANGNNLNSKPNAYTLICSGASAQPEKNWRTVKHTDSKKDSKNTFTEPYTYTTEVKAQPIKGGAIGKGKLHNQKATVVKTNFGKLWDKAKKGDLKNKKANDIKALVNDAKAKDKKLSHAKVNLDSANKAGLAEGGVLNVYEQTMHATINSSTTTYTRKTETCTFNQKWNLSTGKYNKETKSCKTTSKDTYSNSSSTAQGSLKNTGFWQILSVHCNPAEFAALLKSDSSIKKINTGDATNGISNVVYSQKYNAQPVASKLDFGSSTNTNAAKKKTGNIGFYDKECPFDCTPSKDTKNGASNANGATSNVGSTGYVEKASDKYGATTVDKDNKVIAKTNTNLFSFFRDNEEKKVQADVWYPKSTGVVKYNGAAPITTTITNDPTGTPKIGDEATIKSGSKILFTGTGNPKVQKNWDKTVHDAKNSNVLNGLHRTLSVKSSWASEPNKPLAVNMKWEYAPTVSTKVPTTGIGFGTGSSRSLGTTSTVSAAIQGKCYANFGTTKQRSTITDMQNNTGTGTTNNIDKQTLADDLLKLKVNFVRSTTE